MEDILKTCLHQKHLDLGAKMMPFGGFDMPIEYTTIIEEHNAVRHAAGIFDVSHMGEILITGPDSERYINHIFTNDIRNAEIGKIFYGMMLYPEGGTVDDLLVYKMEEERFFLVVNASNIAKDFQWIVEHSTGYTGEDGFELYGSHDFINRVWDILVDSKQVLPCGLGCRDTLRFEVGLPLYGHELEKDITPIEAGLGMFVKLDKEEFIGKEAIILQKAEGIKRKIVGIELADKAIPRSGYEVYADGKVIGHVTTGYNSISTGKSVCMALIDSAHAALGTEVEIHIRKKFFKGTVVKKRFYEKNYKK